VVSARLWVIYHVNVLLTDFAFFALVSRVSSETCDEYESILYGFLSNKKRNFLVIAFFIIVCLFFISVLFPRSFLLVILRLLWIRISWSSLSCPFISYFLASGETILLSFFEDSGLGNSLGSRTFIRVNVMSVAFSEVMFP